MQEPAQPHTFTPALLTDAIHAVVPVAGADQWQAMCADRQAGIESACAVFKETWRCSSETVG